MADPSEKELQHARSWLLGQAERTVAANGSRATFASDMYFVAASAIALLLNQKDGHGTKLREYMDICESLSTQRAELYHTLIIAQTALKSYEYGNGSPELAKEICAAIGPVIEKARLSK